MTVRQQLDLTDAQALADELHRIASHDPTREATLWMAQHIQAIIDEVNLTRRERDSARHVILKTAQLSQRWIRRYTDSPPDNITPRTKALADAAEQLSDVILPELQRD